MGSGQGLGIWPLFWVSELSPVDNNIAHISANRYMCRSVLQTLPTKGHNCWSNHESPWNNIVLLLWGSVLESYTATIITIPFSQLFNAWVFSFIVLLKVLSFNHFILFCFISYRLSLGPFCQGSWQNFRILMSPWIYIIIPENEVSTLTQCWQALRNSHFPVMGLF